VDVQDRYFQRSIGPWAEGESLKVVEILFRQELVQGLEGVVMALLTRGLGMEPAEGKALVEEARGNLIGSGIHG
jgi:hypothetical protein